MSLIWIALLLPVALAIDFYVSSSFGDDSGPGSLSKPWKTISHAKASVVGLSKSQDVNIHIFAGTYVESLEFTSADSGLDGHYVTYSSYERDSPLISGGLPLSGWKPTTANPKIFSTSVPTGTHSRQLYVDGQRATRARSDGWTVYGCKLSTDGYSCPDGTGGMADWKNQASIELVGNNHWRQERCLVESITSTVITMQQPCWKNAAGKFPGTPSWVENALELLTEPGQWYLDDAADVIYYYPLPPRPIASSTIILAVSSQLISGTGSLPSPITNLAFKGLTFSYSTWSIGADGFPETQANVLADGRTPVASVHFAYVSGLIFSRCTFTHLGGMGLELSTGSRNSVVDSCVFTDISSHGLKLGDVNPNQSSEGGMTEQNLIYNNSIVRVGVEFSGAPALMIGYVRNCTVSHNWVYDNPYTGISNGWGWAAVCSNFAGYNTFEYNLVNMSMRVLFDGGSFYTLGQQTGGVFANNVLLNSQNFYGSFYLDDGSRYWTAYNNVVFGNAETALMKGGDHHIYNNYWQDRGERKIPGGGHVLDIQTERLIECCPYSGGKYTPCGPLDMHSNTVITELSQAPPAILKNAGLVLK